MLSRRGAPAVVPEIARQWRICLAFWLACGIAPPLSAYEDAGAARSACEKLALKSVNCAAAETSGVNPSDTALVRGPSDVKDPAGLRRDLYYFVGWQFAVVGILYVAPESVSGWSDEQKEEKDLDAWWDNVTHPHLDSDDFIINYVMHPYWGATYFVRAKERGYGNTGAFWYSAALSALYEFGVEAFFEQPSIQDLIVTPVAGSLLGARFMAMRTNIRDRIHREGRYRNGDRWWLVLSDPLGTVGRFTDRVLRRDTAVELRPLISRDYAPDAAGEGTPFYGVRVSVRW